MGLLSEVLAGPRAAPVAWRVPVAPPKVALEAPRAALEAPQEPVAPKVVPAGPGAPSPSDAQQPRGLFGGPDYNQMEMKMSGDGTEPQRLTIDDPIAQEALQQLAALHNARVELSDRNASLDLEKVGILAGLRRLDEQKQQLFQSLLVERGLAPDTEVTINPRTGKVQLLRRKPDGTPEVVSTPPAEPPPAPENSEEEAAPEAVHTTS